MKTLLIIFTLLIAPFLHSQNQQKPNISLSSDDSTALVTIANYPDSIQKNILIACQNPEIIVKTEQLQKNSSQQFRNLVDNYSKEEQQNFYDLARHPELISKIATGNQKSKDELKLIAEKYPKEMNPIIIEYGKKHFAKLSEINKLYTKSNEDYEKIIINYPDSIKNAYIKLLKKPDALNLLATNMHLSVVLGDMYKSDSKYTLLMLESIKIKQELQNKKETEEWKSGLEKNPEAKREMEKAVKEFIRDKNNEVIEDDVYRTITNNNIQLYDDTPTTKYVINPYPYWFGYPWWHEFPYWYPYPYWYYSGFYWGPSGIIYLNLPSPFFMHWYFYNPYHHYYYSNFSDYCIGHHQTHYGPRFQRTGFNSEIHSWTKANEANLPKGYFSPDNDRKNRIKELGRFEMNYHNSTNGIFGRNLTRSEFLQNNSNYYPQLNPVIKQSNFNKRINYPKQQSPIRFNMEQPNNLPNKSVRPKSNTYKAPIQKSNSGVRKKR